MFVLYVHDVLSSDIRIMSGLRHVIPDQFHIFML